MKILLTLIAGLALSTTAFAGECGECDGSKDGKKKAKEAAVTSFVL